MAKVAAIQGAIEEPDASPTPLQAFGELTFIALPVPLFKRLSDEGARRGMQLSQLLVAAVESYLRDHPPTIRLAKDKE